MAQRFLRVHLIKLARLLDMMYRPAEIAEELGVTSDTVYRSYLPGGCPFERDKIGDIWIHGVSFAAWVRAVHERKGGTPLAEGQAWCLRCRRPVALVKPKLRHTSRYTKIYQGRCETCGAKVNRAYAASAAGPATANVSGGGGTPTGVRSE
jgi:hypothetical protein